jgi:hypothetical protein
MYVNYPEAAMKLASLPLLLLTPAAAQQAPALSAAGLAIAASQQLQNVAWGAAYSGWRRDHSQLACRQFPQGEHATLPDALWSHRCEQTAQGVKAEWLFYALNLDEPITPRLEQFRAIVEGMPPASLEEIRRELSSRLSNRYGAAEKIDAPREPLAEPGSVFWRNWQRWRSGDLELYLYLFEAQRQAPRLELQARRRPLLEALALERRLQESDLGRWSEAGTPLDLRLAKELGALFPGLSRLLASRQPERDQNTLRPAVIELLEAANTASPERRAMLLLAADRLAGRLGPTERESPQWEQERKQLAAYGLNFEWDELGGSWAYTHDLLWRVWEDYAGMPWGEQAFLLLESRGWNTHVGCQAGSDEFRMVIQTGERFLREYTESQNRPDVLLFVAQSYETWWSLSQAGERDDYVDPAKYQQGAGAARERAIRLYEQLLATAPDGDGAARARQQLPRLKLGIDTVQRRFFCVYD